MFKVLNILDNFDVNGHYGESNYPSARELSLDDLQSGASSSLESGKDSFSNKVNASKKNMDQSSSSSNPPNNAACAAEHLSDEALMLGYAQGNVKAFEQLYGRHKDSLLRFFLRQVSIRATAEELFQETWQSLVKNSAKYQATAKFSTYLYRIAHSRLVDFYRKNGRENWQEFDEELVQGDSYADRDQSQWQPEAQHNEQALKKQLLDALNTLPENQKEVFLLKFEAGMSVSEIAACLEQNPEAVKSRLRYCTAKLKGFFKPEALKE